jgi:ubiquinone/menaquinone biosynthesis C-methylase UbiE
MGYYWDAKIFLTSVKLDIYTLLSEGLQSAVQVARRVGADPEGMTRLMDALVALELLNKEDDQYGNTPQVAEFLVKTSPFYMGELMLLQDAEWNHWGKLEEIIRTGQPPVSGNLFMNRPEVAEQTLKVLDRMARRSAPDLVRKINLSHYHTFLDVGGGAGTYSVQFCKQNPGLQATLFDLPETLTTTRKTLESEKMEDRIRLAAGNFNSDPIPASYDVIFLSDILHYQTSDQNAAIIQKLYRATNPGGKIIVKDMFLGEEPARPGWNAIFSIHLLVYTEAGRCFRLAEARSWMEKAGYTQITEIEPNTALIATK